MAKKDEEILRVDKEWFESQGIEWLGKRMTVSLLYYSFPSNQNASGGEGTNAISQKIIAWGQDAEPRIYISPYALKRKIRDWWAAKGEEVGFLLGKIKDIHEKIKKAEYNILDFVDFDLFGYMYAGKGSKETALTRPAPITSWGAVSVEPYHSFLDFNTCIYSTTESEKGGSIFNRLISKEFYFSSFHVNLDLISVDFFKPENSREKYKDRRERRLRLFLEGVLHAMEKEAGGPRDKASCVLAVVSIAKDGFPPHDKQIFKSLKVKNDKICDINLPAEAKVYYILEDFFSPECIEELRNRKASIDDLLREALSP